MIELRTYTETSTSVHTSLQYIIRNLVTLTSEAKRLYSSPTYSFKVIWRHKQEFLFMITRRDTWVGYSISVKSSDWYLQPETRYYSNKQMLEEKIKELLKWIGFQSWINEHWAIWNLFSANDVFEKVEDDFK